MSTDKKLDDIQKDVSEIKTHLAVYNEQLTIHIERSEKLEKKIEPLEKSMYMVKGAIALLGVMAAMAAILTYLHR